MKISVVVIPIASPILIGVYKNNKLIDSISKEGKTSEILPLVFQDLLQNYEIEKIIYVNGPGSYMAIKVAYIFLKTLTQTLNIEFLAASGFIFNNNSPIKAIGKKYFFNIDGNIEIKSLDEKTKLNDFTLPKILNNNLFTSKTLPNYVLPAVT